jgi:hypothetical protein
VVHPRHARRSKTARLAVDPGTDHRPAGLVCVLSWAPAELLVMKMGEPEWLVVTGKAIYAPLAWLQYHVPEPVDQAYEAYVRWWISILGEP